jgi:hypothetical protein
MRLKNIKKIRGENAVDTSYGLDGISHLLMEMGRNCLWE